MEQYTKRIEAVQEKMRREGYVLLILGPTNNMFYFTGLRTYADERLQAVAIPAEGETIAILPEMYKEEAEATLPACFALFTWADRQDPLQLLKKALPGGFAGRIAVDNTYRADHLLQIMSVFPGSSFEPASGLVESLRMYKDHTEIELLARAGKLADRVMEKVREEIRPGISEKELALFIETSFKELGDNISFAPIVAAGPNSASPHHSPGDRKLREGDFVVIDCGGLAGGYCSDITRTFCLGKAHEEMKKIYRTVQEAQQAALEAVAGGCSGEEADAAAREVITRAGYGAYFTHRTGHGIGLDIHEAPYLVEGNAAMLSPGMVFSIEPGIYLPGKYGVRIEDIVVVTGQGARRLNYFDRDLLEL